MEEGTDLRKVKRTGESCPRPSNTLSRLRRSLHGLGARVCPLGVQTRRVNLCELRDLRRRCDQPSDRTSARTLALISPPLSPSSPRPPPPPPRSAAQLLSQTLEE